MSSINHAVSGKNSLDNQELENNSSCTVTSASASTSRAGSTATTPKVIHSTASANSKRLCRNVIIHGFCKYENKGCEFNHKTADDVKPTIAATIISTANQQQAPASIENLTPISSVSVNAPVFIPTSSFASNTATLAPYSTDLMNDLNPAATQQQTAFMSNGGANTFYPSQATQQLLDPSYYYNSAIAYNQLLYHQCAPTLPHISNLSLHQRILQSFNVPENLKEQLLKRNEISLHNKRAKNLKLPEEVHVYHSLCPLEEKPGKLLGHASWVYRATSKVDGKLYTLIRIEGFRLVNEQAMQIVKSWQKIKHANIISIHEAFTTRAFGDSSIVFVYKYHPCSISLYDAYFSPQAQAMMHAAFQNGVNNMLETTLWSFITQLASALKVIHRSGLAARTIEPSKILMTSKNRLRINHTAILDVLQYDMCDANTISMHQQEDLFSLGKLVVSVACLVSSSATAAILQNNLLQSLEYVARFYSPDLKNIAIYLLRQPSITKSIDEVFTFIGPRLLHEFNNTQYYTDNLESQLSAELENSRLIKLLSKLDFINERPEYGKDPRWSETGDRHMIKLFRDYIFHQVNEVGAPMTDMTHVITCLNKVIKAALSKK
ncbi:hypothetical protein BDF20DRAFT_853589 [Mycotypha africana]|uniref:uncharacterized protein n=1 Tax=Mycotypha africana TaxID=64632 RepID=UPI0022FFFCBD|nr:uncharacterized protein BDF20DRAFT_853589 [Mycotypha africana]KAI8988053.1 hypothetical protein BDF20DRAFT_853589 [Mycotypha africana]